MSIIDLIDKYNKDRDQLNAYYRTEIFDIFNENIDVQINKIKYLLIDLSNNEINRYKSLHDFINKNNDCDGLIRDMFYNNLDNEYKNINGIHKKMNSLLQVHEDTDIEITIKIIDTLNILLNKKMDIINILMDMCNIYKLHDGFRGIHNNKYTQSNMELNLQINVQPIENKDKLDTNAGVILHNSKHNFTYDSCLRPGELAFISSLP